MGLCFSKKKPPATPTGGAKKPGKVADDKVKKTAQQQQQQQPKRAARAAAGEPAAAGKAAVFVVRAKDAAVGGEEKAKKRPVSQEPPAAEKPLPVVVVPSAPVRTSSCTKEEVDAILIQCGRLSRSSSGAGRAASSSETGGHRRRRSGSKRSYDFDQDARAGGSAGAGAGADEDWEKHGAVSRPSPHRGSPQRKRSESRERSTGGGSSGSRRASRSPGRRTDGAASSAATAGSGGGERARQKPGKMVSVPAREKGRAPSPAAASGKRCASPRSSSPARMPVGNENAGCVPEAGPTPALSRSSSRNAEQSPYRRNPMAELDENSLRNNNSNNHNAKPQKKSIESAVAATPKKKATERATVTPSRRSGTEKPGIAEDAAVAAASEARAPSSKTTATRTASLAADSLSQRSAGQPSCRSRRASRDFDQNPGSYTTTQLLEDIQSYHQQSGCSVTVPATPATPSFSLPACVAKACSIVEAVADLNSSSSENRTYEYEPGLSADDKGSVNAPPLGSDGGAEPSAARRHVQPARDFRAESEPQESAGSNSVSGQPWTPSWEPTSVESTDRTWSTGDEVVEQSGSHGARCSPMNRPRQSKQRSSQPEPSGRSRAGSGNGNSLHRGRSAHRGVSTSSVAGLVFASSRRHRSGWKLLHQSGMYLHSAVAGLRHSDCVLILDI